jgi:hypothetical protein
VFDADETKQSRKCNTCNKLSRCGDYKMCGRCKTIAYCDKNCAQLDWKEHKKFCTAAPYPLPPAREPCSLLGNATAGDDDAELNRPYKYILFKPTSKRPTRAELLESVVGIEEEADLDAYVVQHEALQDEGQQVLCERYEWPSGRIGRYVASEIRYCSQKE